MKNKTPGYKLGKTPRGFKVAEFKDLYEQKCSIQESSLATKAALWLGVDSTGPNMEGPKGERNEEVNIRMHLSKPIARKLITMLSTFVNTGYLKG